MPGIPPMTERARAVTKILVDGHGRSYSGTHKEAIHKEAYLKNHTKRIIYSFLGQVKDLSSEIYKMENQRLFFSLNITEANQRRWSLTRQWRVLGHEQLLRSSYRVTQMGT